MVHKCFFLPENADDKTYTLTSEDETVLTVDQTGKVKALKAGTTNVVATTTDGAKTSKVSITVKGESVPTLTMPEVLTYQTNVDTPFTLPTVTAKDYKGNDLTDSIEIEDLNEQISEMKIEFEKNKRLNEIELQTTKEMSEIDSNEILNPTKRKIGGYKDNDVNNLISYSKQIQKQNSNSKNVIRQKNVLIEELTQKIENIQTENSKLKDGRAIKERDTKIYEQQQTIIKEKNNIIEKLESKVNEIQETFNNFKEKMFNFCDKICRALGHKIGIHFSKNSEINYDEMEYYANGVNRKYERPEKDKSDDMEISM